eukprot:jgi/Mesen1/11031/ME000098S10429
MAERDKAIVCDNGTGFVKCGFAGENFPTAVFPSMVGRPMLRYEESMGEAAVKDRVVGEECSKNRYQLEVSYPISNGVVQNWGDMGLIWDHAFYDVLKIDPTETRVLLTDPPLNPTRNRERMVQGPAVKAHAPPLLQKWLLTGLVVDSGDGVTHVVPVVDGYAFPHLTKRMGIAGRHITSYLVDLLLRRGYAFNRTSDFETVREMKEDLCYVSADFKREMQLALETTILVKSYTLPDGRVIKVGAERFQAPEALFTPELMDKEGDGLADVVFRAIQEMDIDNRMVTELKERYLRVVLRGNRDGLRKLRLRIEDPPRRKHMVFLGGAVLADIMKDKPEFWISKQEYEEEGVKCLRKCGQA